eukprot:3499357-Ditylum_brightwellii.AAC.1
MHSEYAESLLVVELEPIKFPMLDKIWEKEALSKNFFKTAKTPDLICKLKKQYNLHWLRVSLACRISAGDLVTVLQHQKTTGFVFFMVNAKQSALFIE